MRRALNRLLSEPNLSTPFTGMALDETHRRLAVSGEGWADFAFPNRGPATDNVLGHLFREGENFTMTFEYEPQRGQKNRPWYSRGSPSMRGITTVELHSITASQTMREASWI